MIQNHKIIAILLGAIGAFIPLGAFAQLETEDNSLKKDSDLVHVAFRTVDEKNLLGGVSMVNVEDMMTKAYALNSLFYLDATIGGVSGVTTWGMNETPLVVIDGVPRDDNNVLPSEIAQVTVLKGAAAVALYGSRASKGVIQITTKRGKQGDLKISIRANGGIDVPKSYPKYLGSAEYMTLYNEARANDGLSPLYSPEDIYNYGSGINPYRYPDLNFYSSDYLRKFSTWAEAMGEMTGGNDFAQYYTTMGYYRDGSILKVGDTKNDNITRMFVRGNIDMKLHELITANVDANATFYDATTTNTDFWGGAATLRPNHITPLIPTSYVEQNDDISLGMLSASGHIIDGQYFLGGTQIDPTNPIADAYAAGTSKFVSRQFQFNGGVNFNLKNVADGLFFRGKYGVDYALTYSQAYNNQYATYTPTWTNYAGDDMIGSLAQNGKDSRDGKQNISSSTGRLTSFYSGQFDYTKAFEGGHNVYALLLANGWQRKFANLYQAIQSINLGLQVSYNFNEKYYADLTMAAPYSSKLPMKNRLGFSPVGTLGWRLTNESFMKNQSVFDNLMLTVSGGVINTDLDITTSDNEMGYYLYKPVLNTSAGWWTWGDAHGQNIISFTRGESPNLNYVKRRDIDAGLKGSLLNKTIVFDVNYFNVRFDGDIAQVSSLYPSYFTQSYPVSSFVPYVNYNIDDRKGFDFNVNFNKTAGDFSFTLGVNGLHYMDNVVKRDENYEFAYQTRMGRRLNQIWGLQNLGFFQSQDDINNSPRQTFGNVAPGDLKYKDQNGDNTIDSNDEVYLGSWNSNTVLGLNFTAKWKQFTFFVMGTGYYGGHGLKNSSYFWAGRSDQKYSEIVRDRWTEDTKLTATYPRLTTTNGDNSFRNSDFWLYSTNRFNISMVQLTYDVPKSTLSTTALKDLSVYLGGYGLLTFAKERKLMEMAVGSSPYTRTYNIGIKATF